MIMKQEKISSSLFACLPFVTLKEDQVGYFGPITFWPGSRAKEFLSEQDYGLFRSYIQWIGQIKAPSEAEDLALVDTIQIKIDQMTCVSIAENVPSESREYLLLDALYLLYFSCCFRNFYYGQKILSFLPFRKILPAQMSFIRDKTRWEADYISENDREDQVVIHIADDDSCVGFGKALEAIYCNHDKVDKESLRAYKRIIRSIRYLIDHTFPRFVNLLGHGLNFSDDTFAPENLIFVASSFEVLFDLGQSKDIVADFKHYLGLLLHIKTTCPMELFCKWVDDFYDTKVKILKGETFVDPYFRRNINFEVPHILLGIKLFVYSVYYSLYHYDLLSAAQEDPSSPLDFKGIHPQESLLFFWTEGALLEKIRRLVQQCSKEELNKESMAEINLLTTLFVSLYDRYCLSTMKRDVGCRFIATSTDLLRADGLSILESLEDLEEKGNLSLAKRIHPYFTEVLRDRLKDKKPI